MSVAYIQAQDKQYMFTSVSSTQGLSFNRVNTFLRDRKGFLWVGTPNGLNRYDGYNFKVFQHDPEDSTSLRSSDIIFLDEDHLGRIWVGAGTYLDIIDPVTETIIHADTLFNGQLPYEIDTKWELHRDKLGHYWFRSSYQGLYKYYVEQDSLVKLLNAANVFYFNQAYRITDIDEDSNGDIWAIDNKGLLQKIENKTNRITDSIRIKMGIENDFSIFIDKDDDIWVLDFNSVVTGAIYINIKTRKVEYFTPDSKKCPISNATVTGFEQDEEGKIWVTTDHGGVSIIDKSDFSVQTIRNNPLNNRSLSEDVLMTIYKDYEGIIWLGTYKKGFCYYHKDLFQFSHYKIKAEPGDKTGINDIDNFVEDKNGNLWIGTNGGGLLYLDREKNTYTRYRHDPDDRKSLSSDIIIGMTIDSQDNLWLGTYFGGVCKWDGRKFTTYKHNPDDPTSLSDDRVWEICEDSDGLLWIATLRGGVNVFDPGTGKVIEIHRWISDTSIHSNVIFDIIEDRKEILWFATVGGIASYDRKKRKFNYYVHDPQNRNSLSHDHVMDLFEDSRGLIWAATANGLNYLDVPAGIIHSFYKSDGLAGNRVVKVLEDDYGDIWASTSDGISRIEVFYDGKNNNYSCIFHNYNRYDGLQDDEFSEKSAYKTSRGELLFGGGNGYNLFHPDDIHPKKIEPNIQFTDFSVFSKSYSPGEQLDFRTLLDKSINYTDTVTLKYSENMFSIEFANLVYFHPERHVYQYKLENFNKNWLTTDGKSRRISYTNLNPGTYIFKVRGAYADGTWSKNYAQLTILVTPPFWGRWWFRVTLFLFLASLVAAIFYLRLHSLRQQKKMLEQAVIDRTAELKDINTVLVERQEEIGLQNEELDYHRNELQKLVEERTKDLQKALEKAEESDKLKSAFLANMSHEVRTPMNAIVGFSNLLKEEDLESELRNEYIDIIARNCDSLLVIINDILDISSIEANQLSIQKNPFDLVKTFQELHNYYNLRKESGLEIRCRIPTKWEKLIINQDEIRIKQILQNLIDNGMKFTDEGYIEFGFSFENNILTSYVKDTGVGIRPEVKDKIYEPFIKAQEKAEKFHAGTGLGLAICKRIIEMMGGEISYESEPGKGTRFTFTIPANAEEQSLKGKKERIRKDTSSPESNEILVAEDEPANYYLLEQILYKSRLKLIWARNGQQAIDMVQENPNRFCMILMDIKMPLIDGIEAFEKIITINDSIPVLAITAYAQQKEKKAILDNKFAGYLSKPVHKDDLIHALEKILGNKIL